MALEAPENTRDVLHFPQQGQNLQLQLHSSPSLFIPSPLWLLPPHLLSWGSPEGAQNFFVTTFPLHQLNPRR